MGPPEAIEYSGETEFVEVEPPTTVERILRDRTWQILLVLAFAANIALIIFILVRFDALPDPLPLHFDASGFPDRIDAKTGIIALPAIGFVVLVLNMVLGAASYRLERAAAILLATGALVVQILMWLAAINIAGGIV
ncbi:MAG: DUF1648 domain-containing protein [Chloroflexi bacterium]|nr:DUF1648 domain-containing protein [Chloroflexota bacterium]MCL5952262.1 DUF1648 domain-containing protein [Chloroflexota bacterium]